MLEKCLRVHNVRIHSRPIRGKMEMMLLALLTRAKHVLVSYLLPLLSLLFYLTLLHKATVHKLLPQARFLQEPRTSSLNCRGKGTLNLK